MNIETRHTLADFAYEAFVKNLKSELGSRKLHDAEGLLNQTSILQKVSTNHATAYLVFDATKSRIVFFSENMESIFGYTSTDLQQWNLQLAFRAMHRNHLNFPVLVNNWRKLVHRHFGSGVHALEWKSCSFSGMKVKHKDGRWLTLSLDYIPVYSEPDGFAPLAIIMLHDITPFFKAAFYWARATLGEKGEQVSFFHSSDQSTKFHDIISDREKDVLKFVTQGKSSKEIANQLFITQNTVDRHRKNMLARTGAKDTTALVHICRLCGII